MAGGEEVENSVATGSTTLVHEERELGGGEGGVGGEVVRAGRREQELMCLLYTQMSFHFTLQLLHTGREEGREYSTLEDTQRH